MIGRFMRSLRVQLVLLIIAALGVAQLISLWLFADERSLAIRAALGFEAAGRAANVARLIEEAPADLRPSIIRAANSPLVRFDLTAKPLVQHTDHSDGGVVEARVRGLLNESYSRDIRVELHQIQGAILPLPNLSREMTEMHLAMMRGELSAIEMNLSISIAGGQWLNVSTRFERPPIQWPRYSILTFGLTAMALLVGVTWFVMAGLLGPLRRLVRASDRLGRGENANALPERGPMEVRELTAGFNRMQERLTRFVTDRTRVLAALGHDLRSPLTAMRVHSEMVEEEELRENLVSTVEEMQSMVEATLTFAKGLSGSEEMQEVELQTFLETLQTDMVASFGLTAGPTVRVRLRPNATRRALRNVIENAVRYGGSATVGWQVLGEDIEITISDKGPGIPASDLERVFDPFVRLEESRSLETGGHGLGLSIARSILHGQGGEISLANHPGGGLVATVRLPKAKPQLD
ncbi:MULTISPECIES: cell wall metabolism sensor histidine kinase WalK [unclassified Thioclava]|uniref:sensor histidine kinase n=1 Tax=unclassified Thioclava TaxID=2621713 RepID=UPI001AEFF252|nr:MULTISPECIES: ATP-binding protein [unclassified Thioclava]